MRPLAPAGEGGRGAGSRFWSLVLAPRAPDPAPARSPPGETSASEPPSSYFRPLCRLHLLCTPSRRERTSGHYCARISVRIPPPADPPTRETPFSQLLVDFSCFPGGRQTLDLNHAPPPRAVQAHGEFSLFFPIAPLGRPSHIRSFHLALPLPLSSGRLTPLPCYISTLNPRRNGQNPFMTFAIFDLSNSGL